MNKAVHHGQPFAFTGKSKKLINTEFLWITPKKLPLFFVYF